MKKILLLLLFPITLFAQNFSPKESFWTKQEITRWENEAKQITIVRDNWGIAHVYGKTDADAVFGLMYAQCEENFGKVEENTLELLGRMSELKGKNSLYDDLQIKLIYDTAAA